MNILYIIYKDNNIILNDIKSNNIKFFDLNEEESLLLNRLNTIINNGDVILSFNIPYLITFIKNEIDKKVNDDYEYINPIYKHSLIELKEKFTKTYRNNQPNKIVFLDLAVLQQTFDYEKTLNNYDFVDYRLLIEIMRDTIEIRDIKNIITNIFNGNWNLANNIENDCIKKYKVLNIDYFNYNIEIGD